MKTLSKCPNVQCPSCNIKSLLCIYTKGGYHWIPNGNIFIAAENLWISSWWYTVSKSLGRVIEKHRLATSCMTKTFMSGSKFLLSLLYLSYVASGPAVAWHCGPRVLWSSNKIWAHSVSPLNHGWLLACCLQACYWVCWSLLSWDYTLFFATGLGLTTDCAIFGKMNLKLNVFVLFIILLVYISFISSDQHVYSTVNVPSLSNHPSIIVSDRSGAITEPKLGTLF